MKPLISIAMVLALANIAYGQQPANQPNPPNQDQTAERRPPIVGGAVLGVEVRELSVVATGYRVSKLLSSPVYNDKNEKIGKAEEFIVRPDGTLTYAVIDVGGFLKIGAHRVAIPINQFSEVRPRRLVLPGGTKDALKQMPEFRYAKSRT